MKMFADNMEALDKFFEHKKPSESYLIIVGVAGIIGFIAYMLFLPYTQSEYETSKAQKLEIKKNIDQQKEYLRSITVGGDRDYHVKAKNREISTKKSDISTFEAKIKFVDLNLKQLSGMLFNKKSWSKFIDSISSTADTRDVAISNITNKNIDNNGSFGYVLEVSVACKGDYNGIVKFVNDLEQNVLVTDIFATHIYSDQNSSDALADINISVWGINH
ncbi:MAG: hypothetical protein KU38_00110 [Sulfurovum sp. FS08-3]|nr:MAG: hypothetical protein KU38_00110 [Sulfurovum sp. FS08-3]